MEIPQKKIDFLFGLITGCYCSLSKIVLLKQYKSLLNKLEACAQNA